MKIKDIARVVNGATPSTENPEFYNGDIIWITPKDLSVQNSKYISKGEKSITKEGYNSCSTEMIPKGNILMSSRAPIGLLSINTIDCCTNQGFKSLIVDKERCDTEYLYYYLKFHMKEIESLGSGTTFKEVSKSSMENFEVELPDLATQKKISNLLSTIDNKIINNGVINDNLQHLAETIYNYWFLQFDFPDENGKPYKSSGGQMVWNDTLKREIPKNWNVLNLFDSCDMSYGFPLSTDCFNDYEGYPVVRIRDIPSRSVSAFTHEKVDIRYLSKEKDLLIGMDGNFHMNFWCKNDDIINQRIVRLRTNNNNISVLQIFFEIFPYIKAKEQNTARSTVGHLSDKDLKQLYILDSKNDYIFQIFDSILTEICILNKEINELITIRDYLLSLLMNGQITIE